MPQVAFAPSGYANISASIVSLKRLIVSKTFLDTFNTFEPHDQTNKVVCAPSEDSDQPGRPPGLIRVFDVSTKKAWFLSHTLSAQQRLWSDWADAQGRLIRVFAGRTVIFLILSWGGSFFLQILTIREVLCSSFKLLSSCSFTSDEVTLCISASAKRWAEQNNHSLSNISNYSTWGL